MLILKRMLDRLRAKREPVDAAPSSTPVVPVPIRLRERLADHPGHIDRLQQVLRNAAQAEGSPTWRFEEAVWALEGRLGTFLTEAREELEAAQAQGDVTLVAKAEAKELLMSQVRLKQAWIGDPAMWRYFQIPQEPGA